MRLWSIHPSYLDSAGLVACWREGLLALKVLEGNTVGYKNHPQLIRFKQTADPVKYINIYLSTIYGEATQRNYNFDKNKIRVTDITSKIDISKGQLEYEFEHLKDKLKTRDRIKYEQLMKVKEILPNQLFNVIEGGIENWELIK